MNVRLTDIRKAILSVIQDSNRPIPVKGILKRLPMQPDLSTVYRALDFLVKADRVQSISLGRTAYFFGVNSTGCGHFLSCEHCHEIVNIEECVSIPLQKQLENETHYRIHRHLLYFEGLCPDCQLVLKKREAAS